MSSKPVITFNSIDIWIGYEFEQETCQICRCSLQAPPLQDLNNNEKCNIDMSVTVGVCKHMFHKSCITELTKNKSINSCPVCNMVWKVDNIVSGSISIS